MDGGRARRDQPTRAMIHGPSADDHAAPGALVVFGRPHPTGPQRLKVRVVQLAGETATYRPDSHFVRGIDVDDAGQNRVPPLALARRQLDTEHGPAFASTVHHPP